jgi:superfamily II DNA or RNA helicase
MTYQDITTQMHHYLDHIATQALSKWLDKNLPTDKEDWWERYVLSKLSFNQQNLVERNGWSQLAQLDLSALLRVANSNWLAIREDKQLYMPQSDRSYLERMLEVRNRWAHCNSEQAAIDVIEADLEILTGFFAAIDLDYETYSEVGHFQSRLLQENVSDALIHTPTVISTSTLQTTPAQSSEIVVGSIVKLVSDPTRTKRGAVISVDPIGTNGAKKKLLVLIDNVPKSLLEDQVILDTAIDKEKTVNAIELSRIITAYQINKPTIDSLYSLNSARIDFVPYQFRPALKFIKSDTPRLLIADSVGVGKTIEAGLILKEMQARMHIDSVIIICPKALVVERKWETEMKRFDEDFVPVDGPTLRETIIKEYNRDGEWPERYRRAIIPSSLLRNAELLEGSTGRRKIPGLLTLDPPPMFDVVIVDEAHHIRNSTTQEHKAVKYFVEHANAVLFLTATPLQLGNNDLYTLLNLLFPDVVIDKATFAGMAESNPYINKAVSALRNTVTDTAEVAEALNNAAKTTWGQAVIAPNPIFQRSLKSLHKGVAAREQRIKLISDIESLHSFSGMINRTRRRDIGDFCERRSHTLESGFTERQKELHNALLEFEADVLQTLYNNIPLKFLMTTISRQAASCIFGLAPAIRSIISRNISKLTDDYDAPDDIDFGDIDLGDFKDKAQHLLSLADNLPSEDPKFEALADILAKKQTEENNKVIIFSTYKHTLRYLNDNITEKGGLRAAQIHGDVSDDERRGLRERFALPRSNEQALDVLLFTEVGSEGLDYQFCANMVNYDIPWNPMRIEQRIGRIDRRGQQSDVVHIYNCITNGTIDAEIYARCLNRINIFEHSIGDCEEILGEIVKSINEIAFNPSLTLEERTRKLEQLADNELREIAVRRELEDEQQYMFGLDISNFTADVENAENQWLSASSVRRLVEGYLTKRLGAEKTYFVKDALRLPREAKDILLTDLKSIDVIAVDKKWMSYLNSGEQKRGVVFEQDKAVQDPKALFITSTHPLARQAAKFFADSMVVRAYLTVASSEVAAGTYPFRLYLWEYTGNRPSIKIVPVCGNDIVSNELMNLLPGAVTLENNVLDYAFEWEELEAQHYALWQTQRDVYHDEAIALCRFKIESLAKSVAAQRNTYNQQLANNTNEKVRIMLDKAIQNLEAGYETKKSKLENEAELADIHATLIVSGALTVRGG